MLSISLFNIPLEKHFQLLKPYYYIVGGFRLLVKVNLFYSKVDMYSLSMDCHWFNYFRVVSFIEMLLKKRVKVHTKIILSFNLLA